MPEVRKREPKRRTQVERREESERRMLDAAITLIGNQGFTLTSLDDVGTLAGYSRGLVSHRFGSKEGLARKLIETITLRAFANSMGPARQGKNGVTAVLAIVDAYLRNLEGRKANTRALYMLMLESLGPLPSARDEFTELSTRFIAVFRDELVAAKRARELPADTNCRRLATHIVTNLRGITLMWLIEGESFDLEGARVELIITLRKRLQPNAGD
jgi:AcrR family transcriptional regulator